MAVPKMGRFSLDQRKLVIESMLKVISYKQCLIEFKKRFRTQSVVVQSEKSKKKWYEAFLIEDQIRGR